MNLNQFYQSFKTEIQTNAPDHVKGLFLEAEKGSNNTVAGYTGGNKLVDG